METDTENLKVVRKQFVKFGTEVDLQILLGEKEGNAQAEKYLALAEKELDRLEEIFSRFNEESELSKINKNLGEFVDASGEILEVAELCLSYHAKTLQYFDPRIVDRLEAIGYRKDFSKIHSANISEGEKNIFNEKLEKDLFIQNGKIKTNFRLDLAGVAKGWFVDRISKIFLEKGYTNFVVDIGGDMYFSGRGPTGKEWYIDIESIDSEKILFGLTNCAVATSGIGKRKWEKNGKRFHHLVNPFKPNNFSFDLKSVTVISEKTTDADVWAKSIFLMGKEKGLEIARENKIACAILDYKGNVFISDDIKKYIFK